jgi:hypothetical protein
MTIRYKATAEGNVPLTASENAELEAIIAKRDTEALRLAILEQIRDLEITVTPRRIRESALTQAGKDWLADVDAQIAALRAQL